MLIKSETIGPVEKTNSSYGNYAVLTKNFYNRNGHEITLVEYTFFWKKKAAIEFVNNNNTK